MIETDSILRNLPSTIDRKQALFLDGIRHAADIATLAYKRLQATLTKIATENSEEESIADLYTSAFLDAWSLVDVIDRFRALWLLLPGISNDKNEKKLFNEITKSIRNLRNVSDHLAQRADYIVAKKGTALGSLSWFTSISNDGKTGFICTIVPGTVQKGSTKSINPAGRLIELPTGLVTLSAGEYQACISDVLPEMEGRIKSIEVGLVAALGNSNTCPKAGADLLLKIQIKFGATETLREKPP